MEEYSESKNLARMKAAFKGGPFFGPIAKSPSLSFVNGYPSSVDAKFAVGGSSAGKAGPTWNNRK